MKKREQQTIRIEQCGSVAPVTSRIKISAYNESQMRRFYICALWNIFYMILYATLLLYKAFSSSLCKCIAFLFRSSGVFFPFYLSLLFFKCWVLLIGRDFAVTNQHGLVPIYFVYVYLLLYKIYPYILYSSKLCEMPLTLFLMDNSQYFYLNCHTLHNCFV